MVNQTCNLCKFCECHCHFLVGERENDNNNVNSDEGDRSAQTSHTCSLEFSTEEETKFACRFEEGYDLPDIRYQAWLSINHPDAINSEAPIKNFRNQAFIPNLTGDPNSTYVTRAFTV